MCESCSSMQIMQGITLFSGKIYTQLAQILHDRWSWRSRQISTLGGLSDVIPSSYIKDYQLRLRNVTWFFNYICVFVFVCLYFLLCFVPTEGVSSNLENFQLGIARWVCKAVLHPSWWCIATIERSSSSQRRKKYDALQR